MARPGGATPRFPGFRLGRESGAADVPYTPRADLRKAPRFTPMLPREYPGGLETGVRGPATDSRDEMVAKRGHFARLRELRAHFHASAAPDENDGPFDEKDHPCLVRRSTASSRPGVVPSHSKPERAHLSGKRRQAQTAPSALANAYKLVPFRESILSGSHSKVSELQSFSNDTLHDLAPIRVWSSPRSAGAVSLRSQGQSPRRPNSSRTTAVHPHQLLSPPGPLRAPGPTASAEGPVISVQKIIPAKQIKKTDLKAHVVQMHSFLELPPGQVNIDFLEELAKRREKFLLRALHYLGIPYRAGARPRRDQRLGPAAMEQKTNFSKEALYLDCCGLIRRCLEDMTDTLGIVVGPYNQAYLYDTLPIILPEEELCPGDLIFIQGRYHDSSKTRPKHDIVHVEIYVGGQTGKGSLGARDKHGAVDIFDDFRFQSKSYDVVEYHFRSIDTWLGGVCRSWCSAHRWLTAPRKRPDKESCLGERDEKPLADERAGGHLGGRPAEPASVGWATSDS